MKLLATSVLTTVLVSNILLILICLILMKKRWLINIGYKVLGVFAVMTALRMVLPFEFPITRNIYLPDFFSWLVSEFVCARYFGQIEYSLWKFAKVIWVLGIIWNLFRYAKGEREYKKYIDQNGTIPEGVNEYQSCIKEINQLLGKDKEFQVLELRELSVPMIYMKKTPCILVPDYLRNVSWKEMYFILRHEMLHYYNHDFWLKFFVKFLSIIYWWNPFCKILCSQCDTILEMRVDDKLAGGDQEVKTAYLSCLIEIAQKTFVKKVPDRAIAFCGKENSILIKRFNMLMDGTSPKKGSIFTRILLVTMVTFVYLSSFLFTLESDYFPPEITENADIFIPDKDNTYIIDNEDGTYTIHFLAGFTDTVDSLEYYDSEIPVYKKGEENEHEMFTKKSD